MNFDELERLNGRRLSLRQKTFFESDSAMKASIQLKLMVNDSLYNTRATYQVGTVMGATFVERHLLYLSLHQNVSPQHYLSNLRLKSKIRI